MEMMCKALCNESQTLCPSFDFPSCISLLLCIAYFSNLWSSIWHCRLSASQYCRYEREEEWFTHPCVQMCVSYVDKATVNDFECVCEEQSCGSNGRCFGQQCFSSVSIRNGTALRQKGCIVGTEEEAVQCGSSPLESGVTVQCCQGTLCNSNLTVEMPSSGESPDKDINKPWILGIMAPKMWNVLRNGSIAGTRLAQLQDKFLGSFPSAMNSNIEAAAEMQSSLNKA